MKLVELLARELGEWADTTVAYVQDGEESGTDCWPLTDADVSFDGEYDEWNVCGDDDASRMDGNVHALAIVVAATASDHATAIVTRDQWQAERVRLGLDGEALATLRVAAEVSAADANAKAKGGAQ